ncbi:MAG: hypothetical protein LBS87_00795, partial [Puniceicoccales bacterium]|nr:hypothetical protein [Puniceicoccales bacterium]
MLDAPSVVSGIPAQPVGASDAHQPHSLDICDPNSESHRRRMESLITSNETIASDPSKYCSPRNYRRHLNAELARNGSPFLLGDAFFEGSQGREWRGDETSVSDEDRNPPRRIVRSRL